ncbi:MAG: Carbohydrate binding module (family 6), partial [Chlorobi bacterium OLB5]
GDYDNDGDLDLFVTNSENQKNFLFRNDGNFNFTRILNDPIVNENGYYACSGWGDYDNDGDLDMFVTQAYGPSSAPLLNHLYKNLLVETGTASFEKITNDIIVNDAGFSYGFAWADWDADGDLDLFTARTFNENENNAAYLNNGNSNKWIIIKLSGASATYRSPISSKVKVKAVLNGNPVWLVRTVEGQSGYCGQNMDLHFGLGNTAVIDSIIVEWPSNNTEVYTGVQVNQIIRIVEGSGIIGINNPGNEVPEGFLLYQNYPNPFNPETSIKFTVPSALKNSNLTLKIYDINGKAVKELFNKKFETGNYEYVWNSGNYPSGIYFYQISNSDFSITKKMVLVK